MLRLREAKISNILQNNYSGPKFLGWSKFWRIYGMLRLREAKISTILQNNYSGPNCYGGLFWRLYGILLRIWLTCVDISYCGLLEESVSLQHLVIRGALCEGLDLIRGCGECLRKNKTNQNNKDNKRGILLPDTNRSYRTNFLLRDAREVFLLAWHKLLACPK